MSSNNVVVILFTAAFAGIVLLAVLTGTMDSKTPASSEVCGQVCPLAPQGTQGIPGIRGSFGPTGPTGPSGSQGLPGSPGLSPTIPSSFVGPLNVDGEIYCTRVIQSIPSPCECSGTAIQESSTPTFGCSDCETITTTGLEVNGFSIFKQEATFANGLNIGSGVFSVASSAKFSRSVTVNGNLMVNGDQQGETVLKGNVKILNLTAMSCVGCTAPCPSLQSCNVIANTIDAVESIRSKSLLVNSTDGTAVIKTFATSILSTLVHVVADNVTFNASRGIVLLNKTSNTIMSMGDLRFDTNGKRILASQRNSNETGASEITNATALVMSMKVKQFSDGTRGFATQDGYLNIVDTLAILVQAFKEINGGGFPQP
jgi:hypothetical protein